MISTNPELSLVKQNLKGKDPSYNILYKGHLPGGVTAYISFVKDKHTLEERRYINLLYMDGSEHNVKQDTGSTVDYINFTSSGLELTNCKTEFNEERKVAKKTIFGSKGSEPVDLLRKSALILYPGFTSEYYYNKNRKPVEHLVLPTGIEFETLLLPGLIQTEYKDTAKNLHLIFKAEGDLYTAEKRRLTDDIEPIIKSKRLDRQYG